MATRAAVQPFLWEALAVAGVGALAYGAYRLGKAAYDYYEWWHQPEREAALSYQHFQNTGWTDYDAKEDPYLQRPSQYRQFGLEDVPVILEIDPIITTHFLSVGEPKYTAAQIGVRIKSITRQRMVTGYKGSLNPQGHHLFAYEALMTGLEHFNGTAAQLIGQLGTFLQTYRELPNQNQQALTLLNQVPETLGSMLHRDFPVSVWQKMLTSLIQTFVQAQQWSVHATSGYGKGGQSEGTHKEALRQIESALARGQISKAQAVEKAKGHLNKMFDFHGNQKIDYRQQSQAEGIFFLKQSYPNIMAAADWNFISGF